MIKNIFTLCIIGIILFGCSKQDNTIHIGEDTSDGFSSLDTFKIDASTLLLDSLPTSGRGELMIGKLNDPDFGDIEASTCFPLSIPETSYPDLQNIKSSRYDSVTIRLAYTGSSYGDTTQTNTINVFQLSNELELIDNKNYQQSLVSSGSALYNNSSVKYSPALLGTVSFKPRPKSPDSVVFRLNNSLGESLYTLIRNKDERINTNENFGKYFKGIALVAGTQAQNCVTNYKVGKTALQLYYSENDSYGKRQSKKIEFNISGTDSTLQFNKISADRSNTLLKDLSYNNRKLDYKQTENKCFVQAGTGIATRLQFPTLLAFLNQSVVAVNYAELIIEVPKLKDSPFELPANLVLFVANKENRPQSVVANFFSESDQYAILQKNYGNNIIGNTRYVFNLTEFVSKYKSLDKNTELSMLLSVPTDRLFKSLERVVTGSPGNADTKIKLNIKYTKYTVPD
ncbi:DUF4270 family protein [Mucilaginibacter phyllosphaerae]|uniref:DUF4270 family protein n=1 Tax=Mucilaginibacter phyllosphaerae TaxID=1812349 RepID=A0A4Y8AFT1_9SPHI|nr:DUF4270 family protein [Mucilaginibacter phyllosphaerae]MBB3968730.1 hypothetical protein [Mucilaginibacter phyllosphaerae]TEW67634.1 DUF4270 family protein [Mucilaginibacter phyllosphaerae]GGH14242.1 hypothetical protein GCM10007352_22200 [Mucilaginibacter phyllosphaerae]